jgi:hypothetical protein
MWRYPRPGCPNRSFSALQVPLPPLVAGVTTIVTAGPSSSGGGDAESRSRGPTMVLNAILLPVRAWRRSQFSVFLGPRILKETLC